MSQLSGEPFRPLQPKNFCAFSQVFFLNWLNPFLLVYSLHTALYFLETIMVMTWVQCSSIVYACPSQVSAWCGNKAIKIFRCYNNESENMGVGVSYRTSWALSNSSSVPCRHLRSLMFFCCHRRCRRFRFNSVVNRYSSGGRSSCSDCNVRPV